jgi:ElaB/YqjD/DUF883 family membrane-anchored ribosome-binding protein
MSNPFEEEVRLLNKRIDQLTHLVEKQVHQGSKQLENLQDKAQELGKKLRTCCDDWVSCSGEKLDDIRSQAQEGVKKIQNNVKENPLIALGVSALIGYVIALICSSRGNCRK